MFPSVCAGICIALWIATMLIAIIGCNAAYRNGVRDGVGFLRDPQNPTCLEAGRLLEREGLMDWLKHERANRSVVVTAPFPDYVAYDPKTPPPGAKRDSGGWCSKAYLGD